VLSGSALVQEQLLGLTALFIMSCPKIMMVQKISFFLFRLISFKINFQEKEKSIILNGMKMIEDKTRVNGKDCIKFKEHIDEPNYMLIQNGYGCSSYVSRH
jgi:hypothetical protein